jgi:hypothetical protein
MEHYLSPILQKKKPIKFVANRFIMLKIQSLKNLPKKLPIFISKIS